MSRVSAHELLERVMMAKITKAPDEPLSKESKAEPAAHQADVVRRAHEVLVSWRPPASLPVDLAKLRAMLDAHMFGRDRREQRDDAIRVAWQIDSMRSTRDS
jgi:hypothetical protein